MKYSVATTVEYVSTLLNDQRSGAEYTTWSEDTLRSALREALSLLCASNLMPPQNTSTFALSAGAVQELMPDQRDDFTVTAQVTQNGLHTDFDRVGVGSISSNAGRVTSPVRTSLINHASCRGEKHGEWLLRAWAWSDASPSLLYVDPPVPNDGVSRLLKVAYSSDTLADKGATFIVPTKFYSAVVSWMLYRALSANAESAAHSDLAQTHLKHYTVVVSGMQSVDNGGG